MDTSEQQTSITGPVTMAAVDGIVVDVGRDTRATPEQQRAVADAAMGAMRGNGAVNAPINSPLGETQDQAIARQSSQPGYQWMADLQGNPGVTWNLVDEQHVDEHQHHEGVTKAAGVVITVATAYFAGVGASAMMNSGPVAGSTFAAGGLGNAIVAGGAAGAAGSGAGAAAQGYDWQQAALKGAVSGAVSGGLFYTAGSLTTSTADGGWGSATYAPGSWQKVVAHAAAGGAANGVTGGSIKDGMISGGFGEWSSPIVDNLPGGMFGPAMGHAGTGAISAWATGGNPELGALAGLEGYLFNEKGHYKKGNDGKSTYRSPLGDPEQDHATDMAASAAIGYVYNGVMGLLNDSPLGQAESYVNRDNPFYPKGTVAPEPAYWQTLDSSGQTVYAIGAAISGAAIFAITDRMPNTGATWGAIDDSKPAYNLWGPTKNASGDLDAAANSARNQPYAYDIPNPSTRGASANSNEALLSAANQTYNDSGLSVAARAWDKHAGRPDGTFPALNGTVGEKNSAANDFVNTVLSNPATVRTDLSRGGVEYRMPNGQGMRFNKDGSFSGFLDPKK